MAAEESKPLAYVPEIILKKRKRSDALTIESKIKQELGKHGKDKNSMLHYNVKSAEQFIQEYRAKELDLIRMKQRGKRHKPALGTLKSKLLFIIRIGGKNDIHPKTRKILYNLKLRRIFSGVFVKANERIMEMLQKVEPYVTYGYPNLKNVRELIQKKGLAKIDKKCVPLTDNNIIEQELGKYGIICMEDIVHEVNNVGPHFKVVTNFLLPFTLNKPEGGLQGKKTVPFKDGGESSNREDHINELISKMN